MRLRNAVVLVLLGACAPEIPNTPPGQFMVARFDPSAAPAVVPTPNDLVANPVTGLLSVPVPAEASAADTWFYDWLNTLNGFPAAASAVATFTHALDPATVTASTVRVLDITANHATVDVTRTVAELAVTAAPGQLTVSPPSGGWLPGHRYAVAVLGGVNGVRAKDGLACVGSATWALVRNRGTLVDCPNADLASNSCRLVSELIPSAVTEDPARRLADQLATAKRLEAVRLKYVSTLDALERAGVARADVALAWTFRIDDSASIVFDPSASPPRVPSPNDLAIRQGLVTQPIDPNASAATQEWTRTWLNTLDGFPVSAVAGVDVAQQPLDPATLSARSVRVFPLTGPAFTSSPAVTWNAQLRRVVVLPPPTGWGAGRKIAVAVIGGASGVRAASGQSVVGSQAWSLVRSAVPLVDCAVLGPSCQSFVKAAPITTTQAIALESLRRTFAPVLDRLEAEGVPRRDVVGAWSFTTTAQPELVFDLSTTPPRVPTPNDLFVDVSGLVRQPVPLGASAAEREFISDYLNTLDGFPLDATAAASLGGEVNPGSITTNTVRVQVVSGPPLVGAPSVSADLVNNRVLVRPPTGGWGKGRTIAIAVLGGSAGVQSSAGKPLTASATFSYVRLSSSLVDARCTTLGPSCRSVTALSDAQAVALEPVRRSLSPIFDSLEATGILRQDVAGLWVFRTVSQALVNFDPARGVVPFPNNHLFRVEPSIDAGVLADGGAPGDDTSTTARLVWPLPDAGPMGGLRDAYGQLDGFALTAPIATTVVSGVGSLDVGTVDRASLVASTALVRVDGVGLPDGGRVGVAATVEVRDGGAEVVQWRPTVPLEEGARYAATVSTAARATGSLGVNASLAFALVRSRAPLLDSLRVGTIGSVPQATLEALEPVRQRWKPCLDRLEGLGFSRRSLALAFCFTTQRPSTELRGLVAAAETFAAPVEPTWVVDRTPLKAALMAAQVPVNAIGTILEAEVPWPEVLTSPHGAIGPVSSWRQGVGRVVLTLPVTPAPPTGYPVVLLAHRLYADRDDVLYVANSLAAEGIAAVGLDGPLHGERSDCRDSVIQDDACENPTTQRCDAATGRCVSRTPATATACTTSLECVASHEGRCLATGRCEGGAFALRPPLGGWLQAPTVSGANFIDLSRAPSMRDRWWVAGAVDVRHLERVLSASGPSSLAGRLAALSRGPLESTVQVTGHELGGVAALVHGAASSRPARLVASTPGSDFVDGQLASAPSALTWQSVLLAEGLRDSAELAEVVLRTVLDGAEAKVLLRSALGNQRRVFVPFIDGQARFPGTLGLVRSSAGDSNLSWFQFTPHSGVAAVGRFPSSWPATSRRDFWLGPGGQPGSASINPECDGSSSAFNAQTCATSVAQRQVAQFLSSGVAPQNVPVMP